MRRPGVTHWGTALAGPVMISGRPGPAACRLDAETPMRITNAPAFRSMVPPDFLGAQLHRSASISGPLTLKGPFISPLTLVRTPGACAVPPRAGCAATLGSATGDQSADVGEIWGADVAERVSDLPRRV